MTIPVPRTPSAGNWTPREVRTRTPVGYPILGYYDLERKIFVMSSVEMGPGKQLHWHLSIGQVSRRTQKTHRQVASGDIKRVLKQFGLADAVETRHGMQEGSKLRSFWRAVQ